MEIFGYLLAALVVGSIAWRLYKSKIKQPKSNSNSGGKAKSPASGRIHKP